MFLITSGFMFVAMSVFAQDCKVQIRSFPGAAGSELVYSNAISLSSGIEKDVFITASGSSFSLSEEASDEAIAITAKTDFDAEGLLSNYAVTTSSDKKLEGPYAGGPSAGSVDIVGYGFENDGNQAEIIIHCIPEEKLSI